MLSCSEGDHKQSEIIAVCLKSVCPKQGLCCWYCLKDFHSAHYQDPIHLKEYIDWKKIQYNSLDVLKDYINQLQSFLAILNDFIKDVVISSAQIENQSCQELTKEIKQLIKIEQLEKSVFTKLKDIFSKINPIIQDLRSLQSSKGTSQVIDEPSSGSINLITSQGQPEQRKLKIDEIGFIQTQLQNFTFSKKNKHEDILVNLQGKIATSRSILKQTRYITCEQLINENINAKIKVECGNAVSIGVCQQNMILQNSQPFEKILTCAYILNNEGIISSYSQGHKISETKFCEIQQGDIMIVEVDMREKKIKWINQTSKNKSFSLLITDNDQGFYFIFGLTSSVFDFSDLQII